MDSNSPTFKVINRSLGALLIVAIFQGCGNGVDGPERAAVAGSVTLDGQPLQEGVIRFIPDDDTEGPKTTVPVQAGAFEIDAKLGPIVGQHRIEIESTDDGGFAMDDEQALQKLHESGTKKIDIVRVPATYNTRSQLSETVTLEGPNNYQFELTSHPKR